MKLLPRHYRYLALLRERGIVSGLFRPQLCQTLTDAGLVELMGDDASGNIRTRYYRLTIRGEEELRAYDELILKSKKLSFCQGRKRRTQAF